MYPAETRQRITELLAKGDAVTDDELKEAVALLREGRAAASQASTAKRAKKAVPDAKDLLSKAFGPKAA